MTDRTGHDRIERAGLLEGDLGRDALWRWPEWALRHAGDCPECQGLMRADAALRSLGAVPNPPPPFPGIEALRARHLTLPELGDLVEDLEPFPDGAGPIELARTGTGVRASDPTARWIAVFAIPKGRLPVTLGEVWCPDGGVEVLADLPNDLDDEVETRIVAVATREKRLEKGQEPPVWEAFLAHHVAVWEEAPIELGAWADRVRCAERTVRPGEGLGIRVREGEILAATEEVEALLNWAAAAGEAGQWGPSARHYQQASDLAASVGDEGGEVKAACGVAITLNELGYGEDAAALLDRLMRRGRLDARWGGWGCRTKAWIALTHGNAPDASSWLREARRLGDPGAGWVGLHEANVALARGRWTEAAAIVGPDGPAGVADVARAIARLVRATALGRAGRAAEARDALSRAAESPADAAEVRLWRLLAAAVAGVRPWAGVAADGAGVLAGTEGCALPAACGYVLALLADAALWGGHPAEAAALLRLRFLGPAAAAGSPAALLAAPAGAAALALDPSDPGAARRLPLDPCALARLARASRDAARAGEVGSSAARALALLLLPGGAPAGSSMAFGADGDLAGAPVALLAHLAGVGDAPVAAVRDLAGLRRPVRAPDSRAVASLADVPGAERGAGAAVLSGEADCVLRGRDASAEALSQLGPTGLLHLGVPVRRVRGVPGLELAGGTATVPAIEAFGLQGSPVVVLAGPGAPDPGAVRAVARALLRAGASAVVASRWPIGPRAATALARGLVERWPFTDPAASAAAVAQVAREQDHGPGTWAAPVVYG